MKMGQFVSVPAAMQQRVQTYRPQLLVSAKKQIRLVTTARLTCNGAGGSTTVELMRLFANILPDPARAAYDPVVTELPLAALPTCLLSRLMTNCPGAVNLISYSKPLTLMLT